MFDEDDFVCDCMVADPMAPAEAEIHRPILDAAAPNVPFDLHNTLDLDAAVFGDLGDGPLISRAVRFAGGLVRDMLGNEQDVGPGVGVVLGHAFGRVVIAFDAGEQGIYFLGWVNPDDYELAYVHVEASKCVH